MASCNPLLDGMKGMNRFLWIGLVCTLALLPGAVQADEFEQDLQNWNSVVVKLDLSEKWFAQFQTDNRFANDISRYDQLQLVPSVGYEFNDNWSGRLIYWHVDDFDPEYTYENRVGQEITYSRQFPKLANTTLQLRNRLEQRFFSTVDGTVVRSRHRLRAEYPIKDTPWYLAAQNESFINLNSPPGGTPARLRSEDGQARDRLPRRSSPQ